MRSVQPLFFKGDFTQESGDGWMDGLMFQAMKLCSVNLKGLGTLQDNVPEFVLWEFKPL